VKRTALLVALVLLAVAATASLAGARRAHSSLFFTVEVHQTKLGKILENPSRSVLYEFTGDRPRKSRCAVIKGCSTIWVAQPVVGTPSAGPGLKRSLVSSIPASGGVRQLTYAGHPLYLYIPNPTSTRYVGVSQFGGHWYAINARGNAVK
jgi:predicted lipoprotein with Yx(FWY)xxD motif